MANNGPPEAEPESAPEQTKSPGRFSAAWHSVTSSKVGQGSKKGFDWGWKKLGPVGEWTNKQFGKWGVEGFWPVDIARECEKCARILWVFAKNREEEFVSASGDVNSHKKQQKVLKRIPPEVIEKAEGLAIYTVWRFGLGLAAASGSGIVIARDSPTSWGPPCGILVHTISYGLLGGSDVYDVVLVLRTRKAVEAFCKPKISIGTEIHAVAGPMGTGAALTTGVEGAPVFSYTKSKGLYGGVAVDGNVIITRDDENAVFYGHKISAKDILTGGRAVTPAGAAPLLTVIEVAEGKDVDTSHLPEDIDMAPSDMPAANGEQTQGGAATPPLPVRRNVPPLPTKINDEDPQEQIKSPLPPTGFNSPPPRPPRRFVSPNSPNASPRVSDERPRSSGGPEHRRVYSFEDNATPTQATAETFAPDHKEAQ